MKIRKSNIGRLVPLFFTLSLTSLHATVNVVGVDAAAGPNWRTGAGLEADAEYGTLGYVVFGLNEADNVYTEAFVIGPANPANAYSLPAGVAVSTADTNIGMWSGNGNFGTLEDPGNGNALTATPLLANSAGPKQFTITRTASAAYRITLITASGDGANAAYTPTVNDGTGAVSTSHTHTVNGVAYHVFQVSEGTSDIAININSTPNWSLTGIAFDEFVLVSVGPPLAWVGATSAWDTTTAGNWKWVSDSSAALYSDSPANPVLFDDNASSTTVDISAADVTPDSIEFNHSAKNYTLQGAAGIAGFTGLAKSGTGTLTIENSNTYTGTTAINDGTLTLSGAGRLGGGSYPGSITNDGILNCESSADQTFSGPLSGTGPLTQAGTGTLTLAGPNTYTGTTSVTGGTLKFSAAGTTPVGNSIIVNDTGTLTFGRNDTWGNAGTVSSAAITVNSGGTLASGGFFNTLWNLSLNDGTLLANGGVNATFPAFQLGGTLEVTGTSLFEVGAGANNMVNIGAQGNAALTISTPAEADSLTINTTLQNFGEQAGTLIKSGSGTLTLTAASTYTGATTVNGGTLNLTGSLGASVNPLTVNDTATLTGNGTLSRPVTIASGGTLIPGGTAIDTLAVYSTLTLGGKLSCQIDKTGGTLTQDLLDTDSVVYGGTLEVVASGEALTLGDSFKLFNTTGSYSGAFASASLPTLSSGLNWDLSGLVTNGVITVVNTASQPIFNPSTGGYVGALPVTISSSPGAIIHYTMDGSDPTTSGTVVSGASPLVANIPTDTETLTLTAYASQAGFLDSATASAGYSTISTPNWNVDDNGDWSETTKWKFGVIARGAGVTADFNTMAQSADTTINLDSSRTIGSLVVGNTAAYDWTLAGSVGSALTLEATGIPAINVVNQIATISVPLAGTQGFTKSGDGTLRLTSGASNYTGDVTVAAGLLQANGSTGGPAPTAGSLGDPGVARTITVDSGATLSFGANDTLGNHGSPMNVALVIRGTVTNGGNWYNALGPLTLDGGTLHASGGVNPTFPAFALKGPVTALAGAVSIISGIGANAIYQIGGNLVTGVTFEVQDTAMLDVPAILQDGRALNYAAQPSFLTKDGTGTLTLGGSNTYTGNTTVNAGILALSDDAQLRFVIGAAEGINNQLAGAGTVVLDGDFAIDTAAAAALTSGSWTLEDVPALAGAYGATFTVVNPDGSPWTDAGSDQWTKNAGNGSLWTFDETTGMLTLGASGNYESWAAENGVTGGPNGDSDNDGIPNLVEYALNLNPAGSDGSAGSFTGGLLSFTKRDVAVTNGDVAYAIQESDDLGLTDSWEAVTPTTDNDATISYALPAGSPKKFARLVVTQAL